MVGHDAANKWEQYRFNIIQKWNSFVGLFWKWGCWGVCFLSVDHAGFGRNVMSHANPQHQQWSNMPSLYLLYPLLLNKAGTTLNTVKEWLAGLFPRDNRWNVVFIALHLADISLFQWTNCLFDIQPMVVISYMFISWSTGVSRDVCSICYRV